jgi:hypothetical protein
MEHAQVGELLNMIDWPLALRSFVKKGSDQHGDSAGNGDYPLIPREWLE